MTGQSDFDPNDWDGDPELLEPYAELLLNDEAACDITFASRYEAFVAGVQCGRRIALGPSVSERGA